MTGDILNFYFDWGSAVRAHEQWAEAWIAYNAQDIPQQRIIPPKNVGNAKLRHLMPKHKDVKPHGIRLPWDDSLASQSLSFCI